MRQDLSELLEANMPKRESASPSEDVVPLDLMNEQLRAELDHVQRLRREEKEKWQNDSLGWSKAMKQVNQWLGEGETAHQEDV